MCVCVCVCVWWVVASCVWATPDSPSLLQAVSPIIVRCLPGDVHRLDPFALSNRHPHSHLHSHSPRPRRSFSRVLDAIAEVVTSSRYLQYNLQWVLAVLNAHGSYLRANSHSAGLVSTFRSIQEAVSRRHSDMSRLCDENMYTLDYISKAKNTTLELALEEGEDGGEEGESKSAVGGGGGGASSSS